MVEEEELCLVKLVSTDGQGMEEHGTASSITGSSATRAGGGGGSTRTAGSGGFPGGDGGGGTRWC
jgi:hypothetical protein